MHLDRASIFPIFALAGILAIHGPAWAQAHDSSAAEAVFQSARQALSRGQLDVACEQFAQSERLDPAPGTLINLADCEERRGRYATAWQSFHDAIPMFRKGDDRVAFAEKRARSLEPRVPHVVLSLDAHAQGLTIYRDDVDLGTASLGVSLPIDPGRHRFTVRAAGYEESRVDADIQPGESRTIMLQIGRPLAGPLPLPEPSPERVGSVPPPYGPAPASLENRGSGANHSVPNDSSRKTWGYVATGLGGVALLTGILATVGVASAASTYKDNCHDGLCKQDGIDAASRGKTLSLVAPIAFGAAAVGLGTGIYLLVTKPSQATTASAGVSVAGSF